MMPTFINPSDGVGVGKLYFWRLKQETKCFFVHEIEIFPIFQEIKALKHQKHIIKKEIKILEY
jgi:hypothetical protein